MRRKNGALLPLEKMILLNVAELGRSDPQGVYGYQLTETLASDGLVVASSTVYRCLWRLERLGLLDGHADWRTPPQGRWCPRRYYMLAIPK